VLRRIPIRVDVTSVDQKVDADGDPTVELGITVTNEGRRAAQDVRIGLTRCFPEEFTYPGIVSGGETVEDGFKTLGGGNARLDDGDILLRHLDPDRPAQFIATYVATEPDGGAEFSEGEVEAELDVWSENGPRVKLAAGSEAYWEEGDRPSGEVDVVVDKVASTSFNGLPAVTMRVNVSNSGSIAVEDLAFWVHREDTRGFRWLLRRVRGDWELDAVQGDAVLDRDGDAFIARLEPGTTSTFQATYIAEVPRARREHPSIDANLEADVLGDTAAEVQINVKNAAWREPAVRI
jgi:hypothetical protein